MNIAAKIVSRAGKSGIAVNGVVGVVRGLRASDKRFQHGVGVGLKKAGLFLQRESQLIAPVEFGFLKAGAFTKADGEGMRTVVTVGYGASYAVWVHEDLSKAHGQAYNEKYAHQIATGQTYVATNGRTGVQQIRKYHLRAPNQQAKFLEKPAREKKEEASVIVRHTALDALRRE